MMDIKTLEALVKKGESETVEFKKTTANLKNAAETLCAFLNGKGGIVLFGVSDDRQIIGQHISDQTQQDMAKILRKFEPTANIDVQYVDLKNERSVIALNAHPDPRSVPYTFESRPFERKESATNLMPQVKYQQLLLSRNLNPISWESQPALGVSIDDLDQVEIADTLRDIIHKKRLESHLMSDDLTEILTRLKLFGAGKITNAENGIICKRGSSKLFPMRDTHGTISRY